MNKYKNYITLSFDGRNNLQSNYYGIEEEVIRDFFKNCEKHDYIWSRLFKEETGEEVDIYKRSLDMVHKGRFQHRFYDNPLEKVFAEKWNLVNKYAHHLDYLLAEEVNRPCGEVTKRDREVAATVIQWLGSPVGQNFLRSIEEE